MLQICSTVFKILTLPFVTDCLQQTWLLFHKDSQRCKTSYITTFLTKDWQVILNLSDPPFLLQRTECSSASKGQFILCDLNPYLVIFLNFLPIWYFFSFSNFFLIFMDSFKEAFICAWFFSILNKTHTHTFLVWTEHVVDVWGVCVCILCTPMQFGPSGLRFLHSFGVYSRWNDT